LRLTGQESWRSEEQMKSNGIARKSSAGVVLVLFVWIIGIAQAAEPLVPYRAWQFHTLDMPYVSKVMRLASGYDVNTVVFSHNMIGYVSHLYDGTNRGEKLRKLANEAKAQNLRVWIWVRELQDVPAQFKEGDVVQLDRPGLWDWLSRRYEKLFSDYPEFDGLILTFHETEYKIFNPKEVSSSLSMPERFTKLINTIAKVAEKHQKDLIVRSFLYEPQEVQWFREGFEKTPQRVMIQTKCEPHDWDPFYPHDPLIGEFPERRQIVEFDGSSEFTGRNRIPYTQPEYFAQRWRYDLSKPGVVGYNLRLDHAGYDALFTPNELNIYAMFRFTQDPKLTPEDVWSEWTRKHYGAAAVEIEKALKPSFEVVNKSFFALKFWITNHSELPDFGYADGHLRSRTLAKWWPDKPEYKALEQRLSHPDPKLLEEILAEKEEAVALAEQSLQHLENARSLLTEEKHRDLQWRLQLLHHTAIVWRLHAEAFFGLKVLNEHHDVPGLRERVDRAIRGLYLQANVSDGNPAIGNKPPAAGKAIRKVADDLRNRLQKTAVPPSATRNMK